ncbi:MAG: hypothetical protein WC738_07640, partial [Candidatus Omnitrophota bacterium]
MVTKYIVDKEFKSVEKFIKDEAKTAGFKRFVKYPHDDCLLAGKTRVERHSGSATELVPYEPLILGINRKYIRHLLVPFMLDADGVIKAIRANIMHEKGHYISTDK